MHKLRNLNIKVARQPPTQKASFQHDFTIQGSITYTRNLK